MKNNLRNLRQKHGLSQEDLSKKASCPIRVIKDIENGKETLIMSKQLVQLAETLDSTIDEMFAMN